MALLAVSRCGATFSPLDTSLRGISLAALLEGLRPEAVITTSALVQRIFNAQGKRWPVFVFTERPSLAREATLVGAQEQRLRCR